MEIESLTAEPLLHNDNLSFDPSLFNFDLQTLIENMRHSHTWAKGELHSMILLKSPDKQIVLTILHEGTEINSFQSNDSVTLQIIEGKLMFHARKESVTLYKGQLLTLHQRISYRLTTMEETVFILTIADSTLHEVIN
jgi:hypothetical protein